MKSSKDYRVPLLILVASFSGFYSLIELLLIANRDIFGSAGWTNAAIILLFSFLNIAPAGIFAFAIVSVLPQRLCSSFNDESLMMAHRRPLDSKGLRVAILYTTYNDFMQNYAVYNLTEARRRRRAFFILD